MASLLSSRQHSGGVPSFTSSGDLMVFSPFQFLLAVRLLACALTLALFPRRFVSRVVAVSLAVAMWFFLRPLVPQASTVWSFEPGTGLFSFSVEGFGLLQAMLVEVAVGVFLGVVASLSIYVAECFGGWIAAELSLPQACRRPGQQSILSLALVLLVTEVLFRSDTGAQLFVFVARSLAEFPLQASASSLSDSERFYFAISFLGKLAFSQAALLVIPLFVLLLVVDFSFFILERFIRHVARSEVVLTVRFAVILLALSVILYPLSTRVVSVEKQMLSETGVTTLRNKASELSAALSSRQVP